MAIPSGNLRIAALTLIVHKN